MTLVLKKGDSTQKELLILFFQDNFIMYCLVNLIAYGPIGSVYFEVFTSWQSGRVVATNKIPPYFERGRVAAVPQPL